MIQFNLLPDVKLDYIKTRRTKRLVTIVSLLAAGASVTILALLFLTVQVVQHKHLNDISADIKSEVSKLNKIEDLNKILTIQNQLSSLPALHAKEPIASRLFDYIQQTTPAQVNISKVDVDFLASTLSFNGTSDTLANANRYADTLKFATYKTSTTPQGKPFLNVVTSLTKAEKEATFTINCTFDPVLFSDAEVPILTVPAITSTRSETEKPGAVFKASPVPVTTKTGSN
jgi:Tfp pilus assembly protein PilN